VNVGIGGALEFQSLISTEMSAFRLESAGLGSEADQGSGHQRNEPKLPTGFDISDEAVSRIWLPVPELRIVRRPAQRVKAKRKHT